MYWWEHWKAYSDAKAHAEESLAKQSKNRMSRTVVELVIEGKDESGRTALGHFGNSLKNVEGMAARTQASLNSSLSGIGQGIGGAFTVAVGVLIAGAATGLANFGAASYLPGIAFNSLQQNAQIAFTTMLGSATEAKKSARRHHLVCRCNSLYSNELLPARVKPILFGVAGENVVETLRRLGDIASGIGVPIGELSELYGKARVQYGRLFAQDVNQLTGRGIPVIHEFAKQFGVADSEVRKLVEDGKIGFRELQIAIKSMTDQGGQFAGLDQAMSHSFEGVVSTLQDNLTQAAGTITKPFFDMATMGIEAFNGVLASGEIQKGITAFSQRVADGLSGIIGFIGPRLLELAIHQVPGLAPPSPEQAKRFPKLSNVAWLRRLTGSEPVLIEWGVSSTGCSGLNLRICLPVLPTP